MENNEHKTAEAETQQPEGHIPEGCTPENPPQAGDSPDNDGHDENAIPQEGRWWSDPPDLPADHWKEGPAHRTRAENLRVLDAAASLHKYAGHLNKRIELEECVWELRTCIRHEKGDHLDSWDAETLLTLQMQVLNSAFNRLLRSAIDEEEQQHENCPDGKKEARPEKGYIESALRAQRQCALAIDVLRKRKALAEKIKKTQSKLMEWS